MCEFAGTTMKDEKMVYFCPALQMENRMYFKSKSDVTCDPSVIKCEAFNSAVIMGNVNMGVMHNKAGGASSKVPGVIGSRRKTEYGK